MALICTLNNQWYSRNVLPYFKDLSKSTPKITCLSKDCKAKIEDISRKLIIKMLFAPLGCNKTGFNIIIFHSNTINEH